VKGGARPARRARALALALAAVSLGACGGLLGIDSERTTDEGAFPDSGYEGCTGYPSCDGCTSAYHRCRCEYRAPEDCWQESQGYAACRAGDCGACYDCMETCLCNGSSVAACRVSCCQELTSDDCAKCTCEYCPTEVQSCVTDIGCGEILICASEKGCDPGGTGLPLPGCADAALCGPKIAEHGGPAGTSMELVRDLFQCAVDQGFACAACGTPPQCSPPDCAGCADCMAACLCAGGDQPTCTAQCDPCPGVQQQDCLACQCNACPDQFGQCNAAPDCLAVRDCMNLFGCSSLATCPAPCGDYSADGPDGPGAQAADALVQCAAGAASPCPCAWQIPCGDLECYAVQYGDPAVSLLPCCVMEPFACGYDFQDVPGVAQNGCHEAWQPGDLDTSCPDFAGAEQIPALPGCCRPDGFCGVSDDGSWIGMGCMPAALLGMAEATCGGG
jgi:hypothetical protein